MSETLDYVLLFVITGLTAVAVKWLGSLDRFYASGLVAMVPVKTLIAFAILYRQAGGEGIREALPGAWAGALALLALLGSTWWLLRHVHPVLTIVVSAAVWVAAVLLLRSLQGE